MNPNLKLIIVIVVTFLLAFSTSLLLEFPIFKHWLRQGIVVLLVFIELIMGFLVFKSVLKK